MVEVLGHGGRDRISSVTLRASAPWLPGLLRASAGQRPEELADMAGWSCTAGTSSAARQWSTPSPRKAARPGSSPPTSPTRTGGGPGRPQAPVDVRRALRDPRAGRQREHGTPDGRQPPRDGGRRLWRRRCVAEPCDVYAALAGTGPFTPVKEVNLLASDPLVLSAGGTSLTASHTTGAWQAETAFGLADGIAGSPSRHPAAGSAACPPARLPGRRPRHRRHSRGARRVGRRQRPRQPGHSPPQRRPDMISNGGGTSAAPRSGPR